MKTRKSNKTKKNAEAAKGGTKNGSGTGIKAKPVPETGGPKGPEPTRYGDWEVNGRCSDF
jgi:hypothetical protein